MIVRVSRVSVLGDSRAFKRSESLSKPELVFEEIKPASARGPLPTARALPNKHTFVRH